jgi:hypothetical protein
LGRHGASAGRLTLTRVRYVLFESRRGKIKRTMIVTFLGSPPNCAIDFSRDEQYSCYWTHLRDILLYPLERELCRKFALEIGKSVSKGTHLDPGTRDYFQR